MPIGDDINNFYRERKQIKDLKSLLRTTLHLEFISFPAAELRVARPSSIELRRLY